MVELLAAEILIVIFTTIAYAVTKEKLIMQIDAVITGLFIVVDTILLLAGLQAWLY